MKHLFAALLSVVLFATFSCSKDDANELEGTTWRLLIEPSDVYKVAFIQFSSNEMKYYYSLDSVFYSHSILKYSVRNDSLITTAQTSDGPIRETYFYEISGDTLTIDWVNQISSYFHYDIDPSTLPEATD